MTLSQWPAASPVDSRKSWTSTGSSSMKTLASFEFARSAARSTYDWDTILNGSINVLEVGKDFTCKAATVKMRARAVAKKAGMKVRLSSDKDGNVIIQAYRENGKDEIPEEKVEAPAAPAVAPAGRKRKAPVHSGGSNAIAAVGRT